MAVVKKVDDYQYDEIPVQDDSTLEPKTLNQPMIDKTQVDVAIPQFPIRKLKNISLIEKTLVFLAVTSVIGIATLTVRLRTAITQTTNKITQTQVSIQDKEETILKYEQQKNELSKAERVRDIGKSKGLSDNIDNIRKVE